MSICWVDGVVWVICDDCYRRIQPLGRPPVEEDHKSCDHCVTCGPFGKP